jgi:hypothetical protein
MDKSELIYLLNKSKSNFFHIVKTSRTDIMDWINKQTPLLQNPFYTLKTKIFWILNDMSEFPTCKVCGKPLSDKNVVSIKDGYKSTCSIKCAANDISRIKKIKETCLKKFGTDNFSKTKEFIEKSKQTCLEKYGVEFSFQSENNKSKSKETNLKKYGCENPNQNESIQNKTKQTNLKKFGVDNVFKAQEIKEKIKKTNIEKFGVDHPMKNINVKTCVLTKKHISTLSNVWDRIILTDPYSSPNFTKDFFIENYNRNFEFEFICKKCGNIFTSKHYDGVHSRCKICYPNTSSIGEKELVDFIKSFYNGEIVENSKNIISPYELDIYCPEKKIAIEFDGLYWHSSQILNTKTNGVTYHLVKTNMCKELGIQLIHIFEDEWNLKKEIVKSRIKNIFGFNDKIIYARKCTVEIITSNESFNFQNENHIQGALKSSINIGLKYDNELVALMTFGKNRISLGSKSHDGCFELLRFCTKKGYHIIGGASKLLKYFENNFKPVKIISYADYRWSYGNMYKKLGFELKHISKPNYWYMNSDCLKRYHRFNFRKSVLCKKLKKFDDNKTEKENMILNGYKTIYDCGNMVFEKNYV